MCTSHARKRLIAAGYDTLDDDEDNDIPSVSATYDFRAPEPRSSGPRPKGPALVYVAAPFTSETEWYRAENVRIAERAGLAVALLDGAWPVVPCANTARFYGIVGDDAAYSGTMEMMRRCDAVYVAALVNVEGMVSKGVEAEIQEAHALGLPVFSQIEDLEEWIRLRKA